MQLEDERVVRVFGDFASAEAARSLLEAEGIAAIVDPSAPPAAVLPAQGPPRIRVLVAEADEVRAHAVLGDTALSERELAYLATGKLPRAESE